MNFSSLGAIIDSSGRTEAPELKARISARKSLLHESGVREGSVVALVQPNETEFFVNLLSLWELGACAVPLSPTSTESELAGVLRVCSHVFRRGALEPLGNATLPDTGLILFTSGSTAEPRGVMHSPAALRAKLEVLAEVQPAAVLERTLCLLPVPFGHGLIGNCLPTLRAGGDLHLPASAAVLPNLGEYIDEQRITFFSSVPAQWATVLPFALPPKRETLRRIFCASADLPVETWLQAKHWLGGADFRNVYGLTEAASWVSALPASELYDRIGVVGHGWGCEFQIATGSGEVQIRAPYLLRGYAGNPDATAEALRDGWLRTGDVGELSEAGSLRLLGRLKDQIVRGALKVSPAEVEDCVRRHPGIRDCCVFGIQDSVAGEAVAVALVATGKPPSSLEIQNHCRRVLSEFKVPERVYFLEAIPRNANGKFSRAAVAAACGVSERREW